jgi:Tfp pilus assembly protein PilF
LQRGQDAFRRRDWTEVEKSCQAAIRDNPKGAAAQKSLGMVYAAQQKFEAAEAPFRQACEIDPREELACSTWGARITR